MGLPARIRYATCRPHLVGRPARCPGQRASSVKRVLVGEEQMVAPVLRRSRRRDAGRLAAAAVEYAAMGWPVCGGAHSLGDGAGMSTASRSRSFLSAASLGDRGTGRACSCDRVGCPAPGAHPISAAWQIEATSDPVEAGRYWLERPDANVILATGRVFDVLDVPAAAGTVALGMMRRAEVEPGPGAVLRHPPRRSPRRRRMVVLPAGLRAGKRGPGGQPPLALPEQLRARTAVQGCHCRGALAPPAGSPPAARPGADAGVPGRCLRGDGRVTGAPRAGEFFSRACAVIPGGVNSPVRAFGAVGGAPVFMTSGRGPYLT